MDLRETKKNPVTGALSNVHGLSRYAGACDASLLEWRSDLGSAYLAGQFVGSRKSLCGTVWLKNNYHMVACFMVIDWVQLRNG